MKKFLLSIFAVMLAVFSVQAETLTLAVGTHITATSAEFLDGSLNMTTAKNSSSTAPAYNANNKELRLYYNAQGNGGSVTFTTDGTIKITGVKVTASTTPTVKYSVNDGNMVSAGDWSNKTITISGIEATKSIEIKNANTSNTQLRITSFVITYEAVGVSVSKPEFTPADGTRFNESLEVTIGVENGLKSFYSTDGGANYDEGNSVVIAETTTILAYAMDGAGNKSAEVSATYTKNVPGQVIDELTRATTGITGSTYTDWNGKKTTSNAVYAGQSAGGNDAIQLRSATDKGYSGIITTTSGGRVKKIVVTWNSNTAASRTLDIYGKNTPYASAEDLYASQTATKGTKLGSIVSGTSTELVINGDYEYIGIRSNNGALYVDKIEITWSVPYVLNVSEVGYATMFLGFDAAIPAIVGEGNGVFTATESETAGNVHLTSVDGVLPARTGVIVKAAEGTYKFWPSTGELADVTGNLLEGTVDATEIDVEAYVLGNVDGVGLYKAEMTDGKWLNNANKAYLPASAVPNKTVAFYGFDWDGTTGIENVEVENASNVIYDLTGRRVEAISAPGIYIVNGVKRVVR